MFNLFKTAAGAVGRFFGDTRRHAAGFIQPRNSLNQALKMQAGFAAFTLLTGGGLHGAILNTSLFMMVGGMSSPLRQGLLMTGLALAPHFPNMVRGFVSSYRSGLDARTSAAVPFSHSTTNMDHAFAVMQYARGRMNEAYASVGHEATFMAARYMQR